ncbi:Protein-lysine N-methyltransferase EFM2 [Psilocybe cubensis]|uniref:Uncharacterized protein n=2 Tax=Psilocybe cubensis TaxID=181762 RepID=A0A8H8CQ22_PSICU|nr:Protein-lysine N-methyltransferase EFM2 [Psilocybe cubensis]KAH9486156.1 Protein-lysine N-methyltransferase EFM2 [Psilocybe cubensis]
MHPTIAPAAPSLSLPPLGRLDAHSTERVSSALQNLRLLYFPNVMSETGISSSELPIPRRKIEHSIHDTSVPDSGYASAEEEDDEILDESTAENFNTDEDTDTDNDELDILRADPIERAYAIKWVTGFVTRSDSWISASASDLETEERTVVLNDATAILSSFIGCEDDDNVALTRVFTFSVASNDITGTRPISKQVQVELNDAPLSKEDHTSVGLQSWGSSIILADRICLEPALFSIVPPTGDESLRILELGAGTGMLSIVASKILGPSPAVDIIATDYHPDVLQNLSKNIDTNFPVSSSSPSPIIVEALDWEKPNYEAPFDKAFDIILAADVIYHPCHALWIKKCVEQLLMRPDPSGECTGGIFWLIIPVRTTGRHEGMDATVERLYPDATQELRDSEGLSLAIYHREVVGRQGGIGRADEGAYKLFKIGWV